MYMGVLMFQALVVLVCTKKFVHQLLRQELVGMHARDDELEPIWYC